ncbi:MAG TPA: tetratricopeptide repeat protein [Parvibaculum sp.]
MGRGLIFGFVAVLSGCVASSAIADGNDDNNLCYAQFRGGNDKAAVDYCTKAINSGDLSEPDLVGALINRGVAFRNLGQPKNAVVDYTLALKHTPRDSMIYANRANARRDLHEYDAALADADAAVKLDPMRGANYFVRGAVEEAQGNLAAARNDYMKALGLEPSNQDYQKQIFALDAKKAKGD